jgi:hypothetical protein
MIDPRSHKPANSARARDQEEPRYGIPMCPIRIERAIVMIITTTLFARLRSVLSNR